jgi:hypothetical protein
VTTRGISKKLCLKSEFWLFVFFQTQRHKESNGHTNGHANGLTNGYVNGYKNGHANGVANGSAKKTVVQFVSLLLKHRKKMTSTDFILKNR